MSTCICSTCKNLKTIIDQIDADGNEMTEVCAFGFPSESCSDCETDQCELTCEHYIEEVEEEEEEAFIIVQCATCGKELKVVASKEEAGAVYCPECYLEKLL